MHVAARYFVVEGEARVARELAETQGTNMTHSR